MYHLIEDRMCFVSFVLFLRRWRRFRVAWWVRTFTPPVAVHRDRPRDGRTSRSRWLVRLLPPTSEVRPSEPIPPTVTWPGDTVPEERSVPLRSFPCYHTRRRNDAVGVSITVSRLFRKYERWGDFIKNNPTVRWIYNGFGSQWKDSKRQWRVFVIFSDWWRMTEVIFCVWRDPKIIRTKGRECRRGVFVKDGGGGDRWPETHNFTGTRGRRWKRWTP